MSLPVELFVVHSCWEGMTARDMVSGSGRSEKLTVDHSVSRFSTFLFPMFNSLIHLVVHISAILFRVMVNWMLSALLM